MMLTIIRFRADNFKVKGLFDCSVSVSVSGRFKLVLG